MTNNHPVFEAPSQESAKIWRYMDFMKFVSLLESNALFFARTDLLGDPFEGSFPKLNVELRKIAYKNILEIIEKNNTVYIHPVTGNNIPFVEYISLIFKWIPNWTYVNCWHISEYESAALWRLYSKSEESIAIQSRYMLLRECLPENIMIGKVKYIDYNSEVIREDNTLWPIIHKRNSFSHENELRAVIQDLPSKNGSILLGKTNDDTGKYIPVYINKLIESIYIAPSSTPWFYDLVKNVLNRYGIKKAIIKSSLAEAPVY